MTLREKQSIFTFNIHRLIEQAYKLGFELALGGDYRVSYPLSVSSSKKPIRRSCMLRLAINFIIYKDGGILFKSPLDYEQHNIICQPLIDYWLSLNTSNEWGGNFKEDLFDPGHFEMRE